MLKCELTNIFCIILQGIDISHKYDRKVRRTEPKSQDVYLRLLVKVSLNLITIGLETNCYKAIGKITGHWY